MIIWVTYGYSLAFDTSGSMNTYVGGLGKMFLSGVSPTSITGTIPELVFVCFQMTFACITPALIVGAFAERIKFSAVILFSALWVTFVYFPIAHMVWSGAGALMFDWGALDFAGGTVVHINAGIAGLVGAIMVGKRTGFGKDMMAPHSMTLTMVGASMLWVGWFGFNAGSAAAANGTAALAMVNTFTATAGAVVAWCLIETFTRGKASMLGAASGVVAGLVAVTPAAGAVGPIGAIFLGFAASAGCYFFVSVVKNKFGYDDTADVFGVHGVGGIIGALGTAIFASHTLGGVGYAEGITMGAQLWIQFKAVLVTVVWCGVVSAILYKIVDVIVGLRVPVEAEREGLDLATHGEAAYHS
jgi:Amt family ammonium transporter